jgi:hypothetical protein
MTDDMERIWNEADMAYRYYLNISMERLKKTTTKLTVRITDDPAKIQTKYPEYKSRALTIAQSAWCMRARARVCVCVSVRKILFTKLLISLVSKTALVLN